MRHPFWISLPFAIIASAVVLFFVYREDAAPLTGESLKDARARWAAAGPPDYDLTIVVSGVQEGEHEIEVRNGAVTAMRTGGAAVPRSVWRHWDVPGMFRFLATELENAREPERAHGTNASVVLRADFDEQYGYPRRFLRHVTGQRRSIEWKVRAFAKK